MYTHTHVHIYFLEKVSDSWVFGGKLMRVIFREVSPQPSAPRLAYGKLSHICSYLRRGLTANATASGIMRLFRYASRALYTGMTGVIYLRLPLFERLLLPDLVLL
jgi:hypothetical protein